MSVVPRVLVVDDEPQIHRFLTPALEATGYEVIVATTGAEAARAVAARAPDAVLLDLGLPDLDGKEVLRRIRAFSTVPVIILSARHREAEKIEALDLGADDYVNKPFGIGELLARLRVALRHRPEGERKAMRIAREAGRKVAFDIDYRPNLAAVWGPAHVEDTQYLRVFVGQLRAKLEADPAEPQLIETEPGVGYRMRD